MGMTLVKGYLAFRNITDEELAVVDCLTNLVALRMFAEEVEAESGPPALATRARCSFGCC